MVGGKGEVKQFCVSKGRGVGWVCGFSFAAVAVAVAVAGGGGGVLACLLACVLVGLFADALGGVL